MSDLDRAEQGSTKKRAPRRKAAAATDRATAPAATDSSQHAAENAIGEDRRRKRSASAAASMTSGAERSAAAAERPGAPRSTGSPPVDAAASRRAMPPDIEQRFVRVGRDYHFPDGTRAFTDRGARLTTPSENTEVIRSLISIAQARGWQQITLSGTERFRKEAWAAASLVGLEARGYKASPVERERVVRARARQSETSRSESDAPPGAPELEESRSEPRARQVRKARGDGMIMGRLLEHGRAPYRHDASAAMSYFVKIEAERGERTIWGVDLERALTQSVSQPKVGDEVTLRSVRRDLVTVKSVQRDAQGQVTGHQDVGAHRNRWIIEQRDFLEARGAAARIFGDARVSAVDGARQHPELLGSYVALRGAQELAAQRIVEPQDQQTFVARARRGLAQLIAQGESLPSVRLRTRTAPAATPRAARSPELEPAAVRG
jgi:putative DNA primase/helicase